MAYGRCGLSTAAGLAGVMAVLLVGCGTPEPRERPGEPLEGRFRGWLEVPAGELPFELVLRREGDALRAELVNGAERAPFATMERSATGLVFAMPHYDSRLVVSVSADGQRLDGFWERRTRGRKPFRLALHALRSEAPRFPPLPAAGPPAHEELSGRWEVRFADSDEPSIGLFEADADGSARGTFLAASGDERFLVGRFDGRVLRLSGFDGARAVLVRATLDDAGRLAGDLWSRDTYHATFTAERLPEDVDLLPDGFSLARWSPAVVLDDLVFTTLEGTSVSLGDDAFAGKVRVIEIFGTWCPNCNDAIVDLVRLDREYRDRGVSIVGVAFELEDDAERNRRLVKAFRDRYHVDFPLLLGGTVDQARSREALPGLEGALAYPTILLADGSGRVAAVHVGWAGPATGEAHDELLLELRRRIEELLAGR